MRNIILIAHNLRSAHNVGALIRTADGLAVEKVFLSGYTPYPRVKNDQRLPHLANKTHAQIAKTALGAEKAVKIEHVEDLLELTRALRTEGYTICALEQSSESVSLVDFSPGGKIAVIVGREVEGLESDVLDAADQVVHIPMLGHKESYNVAAAAAMALYHFRFL